MKKNFIPVDALVLPLNCVCRTVLKLISDLRSLISGSLALLFALGFFAPCSVLVGPCSSALAQQPTKVYRIGYLGSFKSRAFVQGLRDLGYVEGKNLVIIYPAAEKTSAGSAADLVHLNVDVIVTGGATVTRAAKEATGTIPIVFLQDPDPVGNGLVTSLARPAGNITGLSSMTVD